MSQENRSMPFFKSMEKRLKNREWYLEKRDPIAEQRLLWQAQSFRHLVHILPGETILEIGTGSGKFTEALYSVTRGRNPITTVSASPEAAPAEIREKGIEIVDLKEFPHNLEGRQFDYVVGVDILDQQNTTYLGDHIHRLLKDGSNAVFFEPNPWNPLFALKSFSRKLVGLVNPQIVHDRLHLYGLLSEIGFVRISCCFTDFLYTPLTPTSGMVWLLKHLSVIFENAPLISFLAGRIIIFAQKPPRFREREIKSLCRHECLRKKVSVVVPCYNEEMNVGPLVESLLGLFGDYISQIVMVNDNSSDGTGEAIDNLAEKHPGIITPVHRTPPGGVGNALREGIKACSGDYVMTMDCDFQHLLPEMEDLFDAAEEGCDVVIGSRFSRSSILVNYPFGKILVNRVYHTLAALLFRWRRRDLTNNLKLMTREIAQSLVIEEQGFAANAEIGLQLALKGKLIEEVAVSWVNRSFEMGQSSFRVFRVGTAYIRVLLKYAWRTRLGFVRLKNPER